MIIGGCSRNNSGQLADHVLRTDTNERATILEIKGACSADLHEALAEGVALADGTKCKLPLYHSYLHPAPGERLKDEQWLVAADILGEHLGMGESHLRAVVIHEKNGEQHAHVIWGRINSDTMKAAHDGWNYIKHDEAARKIEKVLNLTQIKSNFVRDPDTDRVPRHANDADKQRAARHGINEDQLRAELRGLWQRSDGAASFVAAAREEYGMTLCSARRGYGFVDAFGEAKLITRLLDMRVGEVKEAFKMFDPESLEDMDHAKARIRDENKAKKAEQHKLDAHIERIQAAQERPQTRTQTDIGRAWADSASGLEFVKELENRGFIVCRVNEEEAQRSQNQTALLGTPKYEAGEFLAMNEYGQGFRLNAQTVSMTAGNLYDHALNVSERLAEIPVDSVLTFTEAKQVADAARQSLEGKPNYGREGQRQDGAALSGMFSQGMGAAIAGIGEVVGFLESFFVPQYGKAESAAPHVEVAEPVKSATQRRRDQEKRQDPNLSAAGARINADTTPGNFDPAYLEAARRQRENEAERERGRER